jgi:hypothetical protein
MEKAFILSIRTLAIGLVVKELWVIVKGNRDSVAPAYDVDVKGTRADR